MALRSTPDRPDTERDRNDRGGDPTDKWLSRWMAGVGIVYLLLAVNLSSLLVTPERVFQFFPTYDAPLDSVAFAVSADLAFLSGLTHATLGAVLLWAARRPRANIVLVPVVIALELVVGIVDDLYLILLREYPIDAIYYGFIVLHLVIIGTGWYVYPRK